MCKRIRDIRNYLQISANGLNMKTVCYFLDIPIFKTNSNELQISVTICTYLHK